MKKLLIILLFFQITAKAQKSDNVWLLGYHYYPSFVAALDFYYNTPDTIAWNSPIEFWRSNASICSPAGDMLFYTNGVTMCNFLNDTLNNSIDFNFDSAMGPPYYVDNLPAQSIIILPFPGHPGEYGVFHISMKLFNNNQNAQPMRIATSVVDMNANGGLGTMTLKNQTLITDTMLYFTLQATKHGNGRDWWVVVHRWNSDKIYKMLFTPYGIDTSSQNAGPYMAHNTGAAGQSVFSPDGSQYAILRSDSTEVYLFDFDRCSGIFTFRETLTFGANEIVSGCSFSPNSQVFYVTTPLDLYQYDATATQVMPTQLHIATWDGAGSFNAYYFNVHRTGPDGVTYISTPSSLYLHAINDPDQPDTLCNFTQHSLRLKAYHSGWLPEFPNYRLGNLPGSNCDTLNFLSVSEVVDHGISVYPNPAVNHCNVEYNLSPATEGALILCDPSGREVYIKKLPMWSTRSTIDLTHLSPGIYLVCIRNGNALYRDRIVVAKGD